MKRHYLAVAVLALALGMTACSSGNKETTAAPTTTASQTETEKATEAEDDMELEYFYGFVGEVADKVVTVKDDEGKEVKFDVSEAKIEGADAIGEGDEVEVAYAGELSADTTKAKSVDIVTSAAAEAAEEAAAEEDDIVTGTVEKADDNTLTLTTDEGTYTFNTKIAQKFSIKYHCPRCGCIDSLKDFHKSGFTCPILPHKAMHHPFAHLKGNILQRFDSWKLLCYVVHFQNVSGITAHLFSSLLSVSKI